jgi:hypothetical protein
MVNWDTIIAILIISFLILIVWARISKQTVAEVIGDIKDILIERKEGIEDKAGEIIEYE